MRPTDPVAPTAWSQLNSGDRQVAEYGCRIFRYAEKRGARDGHGESIAVTAMSDPVEGAVVVELLQSRRPISARGRRVAAGRASARGTGSNQEADEGDISRASTRGSGAHRDVGEAQAMRRPTPIGGKKRPMPTAAVSTVAKCTGGCRSAWRSEHDGMDNRRGQTFQHHPKSMTSTDTATRNSHGVRGRPQHSPSSAGTPSMPIRN